MKSFKFRLEKILEYRKHEENIALKRLMESRNEYTRIEHDTKRIRRQIETTAAEWRDRGVAGVDGATYRMYLDFMRGLEVTLDKAREALRAAAEEILAREKRVKEQMVKKKVLEKLRDMQRRKHIETARRREQKELDEIIVQQKGYSG